MSNQSRETAFGQASAHVIALKSVVNRLEKVEQRIREAEAERLSLLAEAFHIAAAESNPMYDSTVVVVPSGVNGGLAYRAVKAEISMALNQSEYTTERQMTHAFTLTRDYSGVFEAIQDGRISEKHTTVIAEAGAVIGLGDTPSLVSRRREYESAVLEQAEELTPARLRPVARQLAEQFAEDPIDERQAEARTHRRVYVVDGDNGMADLVAHLPAIEAYGI